MNELTLRIASSTRGRFQSEVLRSPFGDLPKYRFPAPLHPREVEDLERLAHAQVDALANGRRLPAPTPGLEPEEVGTRLFECAFGGDVGELYRRCRPDDGLRLRLIFDPGDPEADFLSSIPWERMFDPRARRYLGRQNRTPLVRDVALPHRLEPLRLELPLSILLVEAAPRTLDLAEERRRMQESLAPLRVEGLVEVTTASTLAEMRHKLRDPKREIHILHFMGHGGYSTALGLGGVFFETPDGESQQVDGDLFGDLVAGTGELRLVVLNACQSARYSGRAGHPFDYGVAAGVLQKTGRSVVAMQHAITDAAAIEFSATFYRRLAQNDPVDVAAAEARLMLAADGPEWSTPVLFLSAPDGRMFDIVPARRGRRKGRTRRATTPLRLGIRSYVPEPDEEDYGRYLPQLTDEHLDLRRHFDGRSIREDRLWADSVLPELRDFLRQHDLPGRPLELVFSAHATVAFAAGWVLQPKGGLEVAVSQPTAEAGTRRWAADDGSAQPAGEDPWQPRADVLLGGDRADVALALSVTREIANEVEAFLEARELPVGRLVDAAPATGVSPTTIAGGAHSLQLANALSHRAGERRPHERRGHLHVFPCAPNAMLFHLGRLSRAWGALSLYEYAFGASDSYARYRRSLTLPPPGAAEPPSAGR